MHRIKFLALAAALAAASGTLFASRPVFWQTATASDFLRGDAENLSIDGRGRLVLGPASELFAETTSPFLWAVVSAPDGSLYAGSGNEGRIYKVDPSGRTTTFFDTAELEVHAVALAPDGTLYAASSPDGRIYKIDRSGQGTEFFDPDDSYIWSLAVDQAGNLYAGTGQKGSIYKITPDGKGTLFYQTKATHVISLAFQPDGQLLAGTESPGRLFRIDRTGKAFLLLDSTFQEIHAIRMDARGNIFLAALNGQPTTSGAAPAGSSSVDTSTSSSSGTSRDPIPTVTTEVTAVAIVDSSGGAGNAPDTAARVDRRGGRGAVYRIKPDGLWDILWESSDDSPYDLMFDQQGNLLVGTGRGGKLFSLSGDPATATLLMQASAQQVTGFARDARGNVYYATSNPGKIFRLSPQRAAEGTYTSTIRDAQTVSDWGTLSWRATLPANARVDVFTRSGNTATPDDTWSDWAGPYQHPDGDEITSPNARYFQWKAVLSGREASPILTSVTAAYLQRNIRPRITSLTVYSPGTVFQKPYPTGDPDIAGFDDQAPDRRLLDVSASASGSGGSALGRRTYQRGLQTFVWRADDDNNDELQYEILYRREGDADWKVLKSVLSDTIFVWDSTSVPNGTYIIKVIASDAPANPPGSALSGEFESAAFDIDNTPPAIVIGTPRTAQGRTTISFEVRDDWSAVQKVEYSLDAQRWQAIYPKDGIFDARVEQFELTLDAASAARGVIIRAYDAKNNSATSGSN